MQLNEMPLQSFNREFKRKNKRIRIKTEQKDKQTPLCTLFPPRYSRSHFVIDIRLSVLAKLDITDTKRRVPKSAKI